MLLTPSRLQAQDWEALAGFLQVEEGGGERRQGSQGDPRALSQHSRRHRIGVEGARPHPDRRQPATPSAERRSCSVASSVRPRGRPTPPRLQGPWRRVPRVCKPAPRARAKSLARRGPHSPAPRGGFEPSLPAPTSRFPQPTSARRPAESAALTRRAGGARGPGAHRTGA